MIIYHLFIDSVSYTKKIYIGTYNQTPKKNILNNLVSQDLVIIHNFFLMFARVDIQRKIDKAIAQQGHEKKISTVY